MSADKNKQKWKIPEHTKREINNAGDQLRGDIISEDEKAKALEIVDNWRAAHAYPMHVFYINLRRHVTEDSDILVAERLKRLESIVNKLRREPRMQLYRMQDLGGCRMVVPTLEEVYKYSDKLRNSSILHECKKTNNYIEYPKKSGYRSLHLIYKFVTKAAGKEIYNQYPILIELQYRTHLQHIWATAVETMGILTNQALKAGQGKKDILRFFALVSSLFAIEEGCPVVPDTPDNEKELVSEIKELDNKQNILDSLQALRVTLDSQIADTITTGYYILMLDFKNYKVRGNFYKTNELEKANQEYDSLEKENADGSIDIVLIRAESFGIVRKAYPNYFTDTKDFIDCVREYIG